MRPCAHHAMLLLALCCPSLALAEGNAKDAASSPRLDYQMDATRDEQLSYNNNSDHQQGRRAGTWFSPSSSAGAETSAIPAASPSLPAATPAPATPANGPDPTYVGSGKVVNGWYYPPPQTTTVVTEYAPAQKK